MSVWKAASSECAIYRGAITSYSQPHSLGQSARGNHFDSNEKTNTYPVRRVYALFDSDFDTEVEHRDHDD